MNIHKTVTPIDQSSCLLEATSLGQDMLNTVVDILSQIVLSHFPHLTLSKMVKQTRGRRVSSVVGTPSKSKQQAEKRTESYFKRAAVNIQKDDHDKIKAYCHKMTDANHSWVPYVKAMFKKGTFQKLVEEAANVPAGDTDLGQMVPPRTAKLDKLPDTIKLIILKHIFPTFPEQLESQYLQKAFRYQLHINEHTPIPTKEQKVRYVNVLKVLCKLRWEEIGQPMADTDFSTFELQLASAFTYYSVVGSILKYNPTGATKELKYKTDDGSPIQWKFEDNSSPDTMMLEITGYPNSRGLHTMPSTFFEAACKFNRSAAWISCTLSLSGLHRVPLLLTRSGDRALVQIHQQASVPSTPRCLQSRAKGIEGF